MFQTTLPEKIHFMKTDSSAILSDFANSRQIVKQVLTGPLSSFKSKMKRCLNDNTIPDAKRLKVAQNNKVERYSEEKKVSKDDTRRLQVTICGGGNGAHAFAVTVGAVLNPHRFKVHWLSLYGDESQRINNKLSKNNGYLTAHFKQSNMKIQVKPDLVTNDASKAIPNSDIIILCVPAFAHGIYLNAIKKYHNIANPNLHNESNHDNDNSNDSSNSNSTEAEKQDVDIHLGVNSVSSNKKTLIIAAFPSQSGLEFLFLKTFFGSTGGKSTSNVNQMCKDDSNGRNNGNSGNSGNNGQIVLFSCLTLPWACRIDEYGELVEILALKKEIDVCCWFKDNHSYNNMNNINNLEYQLYLSQLQSLFFEKYPKITCNPDNHILSSTLGSMNPIGHGAIMYDKWKDYQVGTHFNKKPLFYHGITKETCQIMEQLSSEVVNIGKKLQEYNVAHKLSNKKIVVPHVTPWFYEAYGDVCTKTDSLYDLIMTNPGYNNLTHPMKLLNCHETVAEKNGTDNENKFELQWVPDWNYRYLSEDIPFGLLVIKAIACMLIDTPDVDEKDIQTPIMDKICLWSQKVMNKEYFNVTKDNNVVINIKSKDIEKSRIPQILGFNSIDQILHL